MPEAIDIADLNRQLLASCHEDERRMIAGREQSVGAGVVVEREHLLPLAAEGMDLAQTSSPTVNSLGCAKVLTNAYLGTVEGRNAGAGQDLCQRGGTLARWPLCRPS